MADDFDFVDVCCKILIDDSFDGKKNLRSSVDSSMLCEIKDSEKNDRYKKQNDHNKSFKSETHVSTGESETNI
jgi:hypothetical protein